jgi:hypothetical protein
MSNKKQPTEYIDRAWVEFRRGNNEYSTARKALESIDWTKKPVQIINKINCYNYLRNTEWTANIRREWNNKPSDWGLFLQPYKNNIRIILEKKDSVTVKFTVDYNCIINDQKFNDEYVFSKTVDKEIEVCRQWVDTNLYSKFYSIIDELEEIFGTINNCSEIRKVILEGLVLCIYQHGQLSLDKEQLAIERTWSPGSF